MILKVDFELKLSNYTSLKPVICLKLSNYTSLKPVICLKTIYIDVYSLFKRRNIFVGGDVPLIFKGWCPPFLKREFPSDPSSTHLLQQTNFYYKYVTITPECVARGERLVLIEVKGGGVLPERGGRGDVEEVRCDCSDSL